MDSMPGVRRFLDPEWGENDQVKRAKRPVKNKCLVKYQKHNFFFQISYLIVSVCDVSSHWEVYENALYYSYTQDSPKSVERSYITNFSTFRLAVGVNNNLVTAKLFWIEHNYVYI